ncbi:MAG: hypothetical protein ACXVBE_03230, partial [Bdellovibrionota bacterium]
MRSFFQFLLVMSLCVPSALGADAARDIYRAQTRDWVISHSRHRLPVIAPEANDQAANLVDKLSVRNLAEMEKAGLLKAELQESPWSDYYWATYAGQIANRYNDSNYNAAMVWKDNFDYLTGHIGSGDTEEFSPAEKYDLLMGDGNFTLTKKMIATGVSVANADGVVPTWYGLCHGWAPAAFMMPRPRHSVKVKAANGSDVTFLPSDLKALATLLWANGAGETRFIGGRCNEKKPGRDGDNRETNPDCFDTNPATWHLSVVNQIALNKRSFVMDASPGYEVWNQPVNKYFYGYVNPRTNESFPTLAKAKVRLRDLRNDRYAAHRDPNTEFVVNIVMSVTYVSEVMPSKLDVDSPEMDSNSVATYSYDLELDKNDNIIGGEWHSALHPDFLWVPVQGSSASSYGDAWLDGNRDRTQW